MPQFSFPGASGRSYTYALVDLSQVGSIPLQSGNYILARSDTAPPTVIYAGDAVSVANEIASTTVWNIARQQYKADLIYVHPQVNPQARAQEQADLVAYHRPPMN